MQRWMGTLGCALVVLVLVAPAQAGPKCSGCKEIADAGQGFCDDCGTGEIYGVGLSFKRLYEALVGEDVDISKLECDACKVAAKDNGRCDKCNLALANGKAYKSPVAHALAKGAPVDPDKASPCESCATALSKNGFCTGCNVGFVVNRMFKEKADYEVALAAQKTLKNAAETKCESCAVAMVTDGECAQCKVTFKDGKKVEK